MNRKFYKGQMTKCQIDVTVLLNYFKLQLLYSKNNRQARTMGNMFSIIIFFMYIMHALDTK